MVMGSNDARTQVLVVGAGPVGLVAALRLRRRGIDVRVVDRRSEPRAQSYPAVLHAQSQRLLSELGLAPALFWQGHTVTRLAVYTEHERRVVLDLPSVSGKDGGVLTVPHDVLGTALLNELGEAGVAVEWDARVSTLEQGEKTIRGCLVHGATRPGATRAAAYSSTFEADFVIGADGYDSTVRSALGIELVQHGPLQTFAFFDSAHYSTGSEAQLSISNDFANSIYPLQGRLSRFSFQLGHGLDMEPGSSSLRELLLARTPWYPADATAFEWGGVVELRRALAARFGHGRAWLAGDAAHLTGPLGVQSLNVGLREASELSEHMADALLRSVCPDLEKAFGAKRMQQWALLLGLTERATVSTRSPDWARRHAATLISCLPAADADLDALLAQLRLEPIAVGRSHGPAPCM
jgi:2-polyprenyl-6-methoxyphenol hydroxylase-like FAD-dependent oxidoreductase